MKVGEKHYFTQVGVGIDAMMIRDTKREDKRRFGRIAYIWTALTRLLGFQPRRFLIRADDRQERRRASQIVIANSGILGQPPFRWGPDIEPDDGRLDVCIVRAQTLLDYLALAWHVVRGQHRQSSNVRYLNARREIVIETRRPLPVQADGEIIGETPVQVQLVAAAVRVIVPETRGDRPFGGLRSRRGPLNRIRGAPGGGHRPSDTGPPAHETGISSGRRPGRPGRRAGVAGSAPATRRGPRGSVLPPRTPGRR